MSRKYLNHYSTLLTSDVLATDTILSVGTMPVALASGDYYRLQLARYELVNGVRTLVKSEFVDWADDNTVTRGVESSAAQDWSSGDILQLVETAETFNAIDLTDYVKKTGSTIQDVLFVEHAETVNLSASSIHDCSTGAIQHLNMTANTTLDLTALTSGKSCMYVVTGGDTYTLSLTGLGDWSTGVAPTLKSTHYLGFVNDGGEIVGLDCGGRDAA